ncbi:sensor histidine kinase [Streptomyces sp. NPDC088733]|uniref:sensor histidine kinase n=1 Tax=Streptomyces sp. NPDC088733 TaxID=3365880 RepID=UPI0037F1031C
MTLRNRVALAGGTVVFAALLLASLVIYPSLSAGLHRQSDDVLTSAADRDASQLLKDFKFKMEQMEREGTRLTVPTSPVTVGSTQLQFVAPPVAAGPGGGFLPVSSHDVEVARGRAPAYFQDAEYEGVTYRVYTAPLSGWDGALVRAAIRQSVVSSTLDRLTVLLAVITAGGTLLAALGARLVAGRVLRPVRQLTDTVEHITATQDLTARIDVHGRDEIARLARSFAAMMAAVEESVTAQRRLVSDASHELRTPLTSITTNLELLSEGPGVADPQAPALVEQARTQTRELRDLVNDLVELARHGQQHLHTEDTRLDLLAERVVARIARRGPQATLRTDLAPCLVHADPDALERALGNLVDNAVKWSPDGGQVLVRVAPDGTVTVTDQGPGIPADDLPFVFDRFYRSPTARSLPGSGLGLAIVKQVAEMHGGRVTAELAEHGLCMRLRLPPAT